MISTGRSGLDNFCFGLGVSSTFNLLFAETLLISTLGVPTFTIAPSSCNTSLEFYEHTPPYQLSKWDVVQSRGVCPEEMMKWVYSVRCSHSSSHRSGTRCHMSKTRDYHNCLSFFSHRKRWEQLDKENLGKGLNSDLADAAKGWSSVIWTQVVAILISSIHFILNIVCIFGSPAQYIIYLSWLLGIIMDALLIHQLSASFHIFSDSDMTKVESWSTYFFQGCQVHIAKEIAYFSMCYMYVSVIISIIATIIISGLFVCNMTSILQTVNPPKHSYEPLRTEEDGDILPSFSSSSTPGASHSQYTNIYACSSFQQFHSGSTRSKDDCAKNTLVVATLRRANEDYADLLSRSYGSGTLAR